MKTHVIGYETTWGNHFDVVDDVERALGDFVPDYDCWAIAAHCYGFRDGKLVSNENWNDSNRFWELCARYDVEEMRARRAGC